MNDYNHKNLPGFTLIELLFIVIIVGIIMALIISAYQQRLYSTKIDRTTLQIQQLLQAGNAFYNDHGCSPSASGCNFDFINTYVPVGNMSNPWGNPYNYQVSSDGEFQISTVVAAPFANRIASQLPNTTLNPSPCNSGNCTITAGILSQNTLPTVLIQGMGIYTLSNSSLPVPLPTFTCPDNSWSGGVAAIVSTITAIGTDWKDQVCTNLSNLPPSYLNPNVFCPVSGSNIYNCLLSVTAQTYHIVLCPPFSKYSGPVDLGPQGISWISYCYKNSNSSVLNHRTLFRYTKAENYADK